ncbi:MAG: hypothetical protein KF817_07915 [Phycisphaeraceae bacterium]|nr:hypothetical protein [Phycisphaeraceae bacterium]
MVHDRVTGPHRLRIRAEHSDNVFGLDQWWPLRRQPLLPCMQDRNAAQSSFDRFPLELVLDGRDAHQFRRCALERPRNCGIVSIQDGRAICGGRHRHRHEQASKNRQSNCRTPAVHDFAFLMRLSCARRHASGHGGSSPVGGFS